MVKIHNYMTDETQSFNDIEDSNIFLEETNHPEQWVLVQEFYCDGSGWNGEQSGYVVTDDMGKVLIKEFSPLKRTNNECEYLAVIKALDLALDNATIFTDSQLVVSQYLGDFDVKAGHLFKYYQQVQHLVHKKALNLKWIPRNKNKAGAYIEHYQKRNKHPSSVPVIMENLGNYLKQ